MKYTKLLPALLALILLLVACTDDPNEYTEEDNPESNAQTATESAAVADDNDDMPRFTIDIDGMHMATLEQTNASYNSDYEEPRIASNPDSVPGPNTGRYTLIFSNDDVTVSVSFPDTFQEGLYVTQDEFSAAEQSDQAMIEMLSARVNTDDADYTAVLDGSLTLENFENNRASGSFEFDLAQLGSDVSEDEAPLLLSGSFSNLEITTDPTEAVDDIEDDA